MSRSYYEATIEQFLRDSDNEVLGQLSKRHNHALEPLQRNAWLGQIRHLRGALATWGSGSIFLEYSIPRMGKRCDAVLLSHGYVFVLEYKVGTKDYSRGFEQVLDYALDLKNFHAGSYERPIVPILIATEAPEMAIEPHWYEDRVAQPVRANSATLITVLKTFAQREERPIDPKSWGESPYRPTPTIVEAAKALYEGHKVEEISRSDAGAQNLTRTTEAVSQAIARAKAEHQKTICFITGVPGSGKTLAGLHLAASRKRAHQEDNAVFLSGNGPLVEVLSKALSRDEVERRRAAGERMTQRIAAATVKSFVQNIHHFRDANLESTEPPNERVVIFDEAQRAWNQAQLARFMDDKRDIPNFEQSEPEFLLSVMDRHSDWCVVICLIGGGQEINTGEAGLPEWFSALERKFPHWRVLYSHRIDEPEYSLGTNSLSPKSIKRGEVVPELHLGVSIRSFRAEHLSSFVGAVIEGSAEKARRHMAALDRYPLVLTRDLAQARNWLRQRARGTERYGLVAASCAVRLKAEGLHVTSKIQPAEWFLNEKSDVRSSYQLEDVATEFDVQGLELDWVGVCWDGSFRYTDPQWSFHDFRGTKWQNIHEPLRRIYLANAYRVLLSRARQGQVIFVPKGNVDDATCHPSFYDGTFEFLKACGARVLGD